MKRHFFLFACVVLLFGCDSEEPKVDVRAQAVGTYNYRMKFYTPIGSDLVYLGSAIDDIGTFLVEVNPSDQNSIVVKEGGEVFIDGNKVAEASNGFTFDIPSQSYTDEDGETFQLAGYDGYELAGVKYHGAYITANSRLVFYAEITQPGSSGSLVVEVTATKI